MRLATLLLVGVFAAGSAHAASFSVSPLRADLTAKTKSASFTVTNSSSSPVSFQVAVMKWTQDEKANDVYVESKDLVVFPRQFEVPAGGKRLVRVGIEGAPVEKESAYRVFIEELPPAASALEGRK